jgi:hypothetical protein
MERIDWLCKLSRYRRRIHLPWNADEVLLGSRKSSSWKSLVDEGVRRKHQLPLQPNVNEIHTTEDVNNLAAKGKPQPLISTKHEVDTTKSSWG